MVKVINKNLYTTILPKNLWVVYANGIWRCGKATNPGLDKLRLGKDFMHAVDPFVQDNFLILPNPAYGISFSNTIEKLKAQPVSGYAWLLPSGKILPDGLVFNYKNIDHPLLNVSRPMLASELKIKLSIVASLMLNTNKKV